MNSTARITLTLARISLGWIFFYAGLTKFLADSWSASGYISSSTAFPTFFAWLSAPENITWVNALNIWGAMAIGVSLILGLFTRIGAFFGAVMMILYWLPIFHFPYAGEHSLIIDDHIIYAFILLFFAAYGAGKYYGIDAIIRKRKEKK